MSTDPKQGEREYFARIGAAGIAHSLGKPFSDEYCSEMLANIDALFHLLPPPPGRIIEFGCGVGWLSLFFAQRGYAVTGVDISPEAIAAANREREARQLTHARFVTDDYETFVAAEPADCALFYDSLHHAEDELAALRCAFNALRPGGMLIAFEPAAGHSRTEASLRAVREFGVHEKEMTTDHIARLGQQAGFVRHLVLIRPHQMMRRLYRPSYGKATSQLDLRFRLLLSKFRIIRWLLHQTYEENFIVLWK